MADSQDSQKTQETQGPTAMTLTRAGLRVLAQGQTGQPIDITRVSVGDGNRPDTPLEDMASLVHEIRDVPINGKEIVGDGTVRIDTVISNKGITEPYFLREVGVWAVDNDTGREVLYSYANYGAGAVFIPSDGGPHAVNFDYQIFVIIGQAENVSVTVTEGYGFATQKDIERSIDGLFRDAAPIEHFWVADEEEPYKLRPATDDDVIAYLFDRTASDDEPVLIGFRPEDRQIFGIPLNRIVVRAEHLSGGNPSMDTDDYEDSLPGGDPAMDTDDYGGTVSGGDPYTI